MDLSLHNLENHEVLNVMRRMSSSGQLQLLRTTMKPEAVALVVQMYENMLKPDPVEWMMLGLERRNEMTLTKYGLLELFRKTQKFEGYKQARESCKAALGNLSTLKHVRKLSQLKPATPEFDVEYFFSDFVPWGYGQALIDHQGTIADAAGRGDLDFFKRLYNRVKNDESKKAGGQYEHFLVTIWLHGFVWLMPDRLAGAEVAERLRRLFEAGENEGFEGRKSASDRKQEYAKGVLLLEELKGNLDNSEGDNKQESASRAQQDKQRNRFRKAIKNLGLCRHPESPVIGTKKPAAGEPNANCYVWKNGWPK